MGSTQLINIPGLDATQGLAHVNNDASKYKQLLCLFAETHSQDMKRVQAYLVEERIQEAKRLTHDLTNVSAVLGAARVSDLAAKLEAAFYVNSAISECSELARLCDSELTQLIQAILSGRLKSVRVSKISPT